MFKKFTSLLVAGLASITCTVGLTTAASTGTASAAGVSYSGSCATFSGSLSWSGTSNFSFGGTVKDTCPKDGRGVKLQMKLDRPFLVGDSHWFDVCSAMNGLMNTMCQQSNPWWSSSKVDGVWIRTCIQKNNALDDCSSSKYYDNPNT